MYTYGHTFKINVAVVVVVDWICLLFSSLCNWVSLECTFSYTLERPDLFTLPAEISHIATEDERSLLAG